MSRVTFSVLLAGTYDVLRFALEAKAMMCSGPS